DDITASSDALAHLTKPDRTDYGLKQCQGSACLTLTKGVIPTPEKTARQNHQEYQKAHLLQIARIHERNIQRVASRKTVLSRLSHDIFMGRKAQGYREVTLCC
ncbi:MAG: hypothetical protein M1356_09895, partial [Gammaproteobacteria bacterium]|nr:hypothetical protein [Gammaproteobacteria bacterium]